MKRRDHDARVDALKALPAVRALLDAHEKRLGRKLYRFELVGFVSKVTTLEPTAAAALRRLLTRKDSKP